jgi:molybdopterin molybdotransferase
MISVEEALSQILSEAQPLGAERVDLLSSRGRLAAEEARATRVLPPFDNSAMDGYAVRAAEGEKARRVVGAVACGDPPGALAVGPGQAARIMTGAPMPEGADAVVMQEEATREGDAVSFSRAPTVGQHIRRRGTDVAAGEALLAPGEEITPAHVAALAAQGRSFLAVYRRPAVAIVSTGSELAEIDEAPGPGAIVNSNAYALAALCAEAGAAPTILGIARDDRAETEALLRRALFADAILTSGGVSVGEFDYVKEALSALGYEPRFWKIAMKPGKPVVYGRLSGRPVLGLPGNPASCQVSFELFARPMLRAMAGDPAPLRPRLPARLAAAIAGGDRRTFVRAKLSRGEGGELHAAPLRKQGSGELRSMLGANALLDIPAGARLAAGEAVSAVVYDLSFLQGRL